MHFSNLLTILVFTASAVSRPWHDFPKPDSSIVKKHIADRDAMIADEKTDRQDYQFRKALSPVAKKAERIVKRIRQDEIDHFWRVYSTPDHEEDERFAGEMFPLVREYISQTKLWKIVKRMPKGALLHVHLSAMLPYDILLDTVMNTEGMVFNASQNLATEDSQESATVAFAHSNVTIESGASIGSESYVPGTQVAVKIAAESFPGGPAAFRKYVKSKLEIPPEESVRHELGVDQIWRRFEAAFNPAGSLLTYEPIVRTFYRRLFEQLVDDGINWVEIRAGASDNTLVPEGDEAADTSHQDIWWDIMSEEVSRFQNTDKGKKLWGVRVIWSDYRGDDRDTLVKSMKIALERKVKHSELFSGYDLLAQEDLGRTLLDMAPELIWFQEQATDMNLTVPFFFHAGETLGDGNSTDLNLFDALLFKTRRIGHGFSLYKHPQLIHDVIESQVMVEVCPISNEVLRLATDILHHPLPAMVAHGVPTAISNDDPAILGQDAAGLSYDFYQVIQAFDNIGLGGLGALAQNSIRWSNFEDQSDKNWRKDIDLGDKGHGIKAKRIQDWNKQWEEYCQWIVDEFGKA